MNRCIIYTRVFKRHLSDYKIKLDINLWFFKFLPKEFTIGQLQHIYETIQCESLDKRNFRNIGLGRNDFYDNFLKEMSTFYKHEVFHDSKVIIVN